MFLNDLFSVCMHGLFLFFINPTSFSFHVKNNKDIIVLLLYCNINLLSHTVSPAAGFVTVRPPNEIKTCALKYHDHQKVIVRDHRSCWPTKYRLFGHWVAVHSECIEIEFCFAKESREKAHYSIQINCIILMSIKCECLFHVQCNFKMYKGGVVNTGGVLRTTLKLNGKPAGSN